MKLSLLSERPSRDRCGEDSLFEECLTDLSPPPPPSTLYYVASSLFSNFVCGPSRSPEAPITTATAQLPHFSAGLASLPSFAELGRIWRQMLADTAHLRCMLANSGQSCPKHVKTRAEYGVTSAAGRDGGRHDGGLRAARALPPT